MNKVIVESIMLHQSKGLIDFKERKVGRVTTTQKNSAYFPNTIKFEKDLKTRRK